MVIWRWSSVAVLGVAALMEWNASAQMSLGSVVDLALRNDPKVKIAQADLTKARATVSEARRAYVPAIITSGGYGGSTGVPLGLPVVFSLSAQSLLYNFSQPDFIRAAQAGAASAQFALDEARNAAAEDAVSTYVALDIALRRRAAITQASEYSTRLSTIVQQRFDAGLEPHIEVSRSHLTASQLKLQALRVADDAEGLSDHLARLIGMTGAVIETVHDSIPEFTTPVAPEKMADSNALKAAEAVAVARQYTARGDSRYAFRPQFGFSAGFSRITTNGNNYALYYPGFNTEIQGRQRSFNSLYVDVQITVPLLDMVHRARARQSAAEAVKARFEVESDRLQFAQGQMKLRHAAAELAAQAESKAAERDIAQDQLEAIQVQLQAGAAPSANGVQMSPKDEQNARLQERQRAIEMLDLELQLRQAQINLMRQTEGIGSWLHATITPAGAPTGGTAPAVIPARP